MLILKKYLILKSNLKYCKVAIENIKINHAKCLASIQKPSSLVNIFLVVVINDLSCCIDRLRRFFSYIRRCSLDSGFPIKKKKKKVLFGLKVFTMTLEKYNLYLA